MIRALHVALAGVAIIAAAGCSKRNAVDYRGAGLQVDTLVLSDRVAVYRAALAASFPVEDPNLYILADPLLLPRREGLVGGDPVANDVMGAMKARGLVDGNCQLPVRETRVPLVCRADRAGYVVRFSDPFRLGRDSVQVHLAVQQYAIPNGPRAERLRFERAYHIARRDGGWNAVREARLQTP